MSRTEVVEKRALGKTVQIPCVDVVNSDEILAASSKK